MNPTSRQQVLDATDEQLNEWAATVVMGWIKAVNYYLQPVEGSTSHILIAEIQYTPASDLAQAMGMVEVFIRDETEWRFELTYWNAEHSWYCSMEKHAKEEEDCDCWGVLNPSLPHAITQDCIMAKLGL